MIGWREFLMGFSFHERIAMHEAQIRNQIARHCRIGRVKWR